MPIWEGCKFRISFPIVSVSTSPPKTPYKCIVFRSPSQIFLHHQWCVIQLNDRQLCPNQEKRIFSIFKPIYNCWCLTAHLTAGVAGTGWKVILKKGRGKGTVGTEISISSWYGRNVFSSKWVEKSILWYKEGDFATDNSSRHDTKV